MRSFKIAVAIGFFLTSAALAQQPPASPSEQALAQKLMAEIGTGIQCSTATITLQQQLAAAQERIKKLEADQKPQEQPPK